MYSIGKIGVLMPEIADPMHEAGLPVSESSIFYGEFWKGIPKKIAEQIAEGCSDRMLHALSKRHGINEHEQYLFPTAYILPALQVPHEPKMLLLTSLHNHGQIFGYLATAYISSGQQHHPHCRYSAQRYRENRFTSILCSA